MAQQVQILLIDDLDGGEATETVAFALDGAAYEIDLSGENSQKLRDSLQPFVEKGRKAGMQRGGRRSARTANNRERSADMRAWAKQRGIDVNERGRIPQSVVEQYEASH